MGLNRLKKICFFIIIFTSCFSIFSGLMNRYVIVDRFTIPTPLMVFVFGGLLQLKNKMLPWLFIFNILPMVGVFLLEKKRLLYRLFVYIPYGCSIFLFVPYFFITFGFFYDCGFMISVVVDCMVLILAILLDIKTKKKL